MKKDTDFMRLTTFANHQSLPGLLKKKGGIIDFIPERNFIFY